MMILKKRVDFTGWLKAILEYLESRLKIHRQIEIERAKQLTPTIKVTQTGKYDQGHGKRMVTRIFEDLN